MMMPPRPRPSAPTNVDPNSEFGYDSGDVDDAGEKITRLTKYFREMSGEIERVQENISEVNDMSSKKGTFFDIKETQARQKSMQAQLKAMRDIVKETEELARKNNGGEPLTDEQVAETKEVKQAKVALRDLEDAYTEHSKILANRIKEEKGYNLVLGNFATAFSKLGIGPVATGASKALTLLMSSTIGLAEASNGASETLNFTKANIKDFAQIFADGGASIRETLEANMARDAQWRAENVSTVTESIKKGDGVFKKFSTSISNYANKLPGATKATELLSNGMGKVGSVAGKFSGVFSKVSGKISGLIGGLEGPINMISQYAGKLNVVWEGVKLGFDIFNSLTGKSEAQILARVENLKSEYKILQDINELQEGGDYSAVTEKRLQLTESINAMNEEFEFWDKNKEQLTNGGEQYASILHTIANSFVGLGPVIYGKAGEEMERIKGEYATANAELMMYITDTSVEITQRLGEQAKITERGKEALDNLSESEKDLSDMREDIVKSQLKLTQDIQDKQDEYDQETSDLKDAREKEDKRLTKDYLDALDDMEEQYREDSEDASETHFKDLKDTQKTFYDDLQQMAKDHAVALEELDTTYRDDIRTLDKDYREDSLKSEETYRKTIADMEEQYNEDKIQRQKDLQFQLWEAEMSNDALQYFTLMRQGEKEATEADKEHQKSLTEEEERRQEERDEARKEYEKSRLEKQEEYEKDRQLAIDAHEKAMADRHEQFKELIETKKDEFAEERRIAEENHKIELGDKAEQFEQDRKAKAEERKIEDGERAEAFAKEIDSLKKTFDAEVEYFEMREKLLQAYVDNLKKAQNEQFANSQKILGLASINKDNVVDAQMALGELNKRIETLKGIDATGDLTSNEKVELERALKMKTTIEDAIAKQSGSLSAATIGYLESIMIENSRIAVSEIAKQYADDTQYFSENGDMEGYENNKLVAETTQKLNDAGNAVSFLANETQKTIQNLGLSYTEGIGFANTEMMSAIQTGMEAVMGQDNGQSLASLLLEAAKRSAGLIDSGKSIVDAREKAQEEEIAVSEKYYYDGIENLNDYNQQIEGALGSSYDSSIGMTEDFAEDWLKTNQDMNATSIENDIDAYSQKDKNQLDYLKDSAKSLLSSFVKKTGLQNVFQNKTLEMSKTHDELMQEMKDANSVRIEESERTKNQTLEDMANQQSETLTSITQDSATEIIQIYSDMLDSLVSKTKNASMSAAGSTSKTSTSATGWWTTAKNYMNGFYDSIVNSQNGADTIGLGGDASKYVAAAEGAYITKPTVVLAGERGPELIMPFNKSKGIENDALGRLGKEMALELTNPYLQQIGAISDMVRGNGNSKAVNVQFGNIQIGNGMSRQEVFDKLTMMQDAIVEALAKSVN